MSRSGYNDGGDGGEWSLICWRGAVKNAIRGRRGQAFLRELILALDALPVKELIARDLRWGDRVCALGAVGQARNLDLEAFDPDDYHALAGAFGIAEAMIREIEYENDEQWSTRRASPEDRWAHMRQWAEANLNAGASLLAPDQQMSARSDQLPP